MNFLFFVSSDDEIYISIVISAIHHRGNWSEFYVNAHVFRTLSNFNKSESLAACGIWYIFKINLFWYEDNKLVSILYIAKIFFKTPLGRCWIIYNNKKKCYIKFFEISIISIATRVGRPSIRLRQSNPCRYTV